MLIYATLLNKQYLTTLKTSYRDNGKDKPISNPRYEVILGVDKGSAAADMAVEAALEAAEDAGLNNLDEDLLLRPPAGMGHAIADGDEGLAANYENNSGRLIIRAHTFSNITLFDKDSQRTLTDEQFHPGCDVMVDINFSANNPMKRVTCYINAIRYISAGTPLAVGGFDKGILADISPEQANHRVNKQDAPEPKAKTSTRSRAKTKAEDKTPKAGEDTASEALKSMSKDEIAKLLEQMG